jgi:hypothetical protein
MIWKTPLDIPLRSSRLIRRVILDHKLPAGWPLKWGGMWDIYVDGVLVSTGLSALTWTGNEWITFIKKQHERNLDNP